jgi:hypothetical protein
MSVSARRQGRVETHRRISLLTLRRGKNLRSAGELRAP